MLEFLWVLHWMCSLPLMGYHFYSIYLQNPWERKVLYTIFSKIESVYPLSKFFEELKIATGSSWNWPNSVGPTFPRVNNNISLWLFQPSSVPSVLQPPFVTLLLYCHPSFPQIKLFTFFQFLPAKYLCLNIDISWTVPPLSPLSFSTLPLSVVSSGFIL